MGHMKHVTKAVTAGAKSAALATEAALPTRAEYRDEWRSKAKLVEGLPHLEGVGYKIASCPSCHICRYEDRPYLADDWDCYDCGIIKIRAERAEERKRVHRANAKRGGPGPEKGQKQGGKYK